MATVAFVFSFTDGRFGLEGVGDELSAAPGTGLSIFCLNSVLSLLQYFLPTPDLVLPSTLTQPEQCL